MMLFESVFLLGALAVGALWFARGGSSEGLGAPPQARSLEVLDRRLAEGAITIEEYRAVRAVLR